VHLHVHENLRIPAAGKLAAKVGSLVEEPAALSSVHVDVYEHVHATRVRLARAS
jgi:hypothetical protein